jgi:hypothetical protein
MDTEQSSDQVIEAALAVIAERHPTARSAFLGGSVLTSRRTPTSDLDIVVLLDEGTAPCRESLHAAGWPVEMFAHTEESWRAFIEREVAQRRSPLLFMCGEGRLLFDRDGSGTRIADKARAFLVAGPPPVTPEEWEDRRYPLTDLLDDLAGCTDPAERLFIVTELARMSSELVLLVRGSWIGGGKWLARRLAEADPAYAKALPAAVGAAVAGDPDGLVGLVRGALDLCGGPLWAGYRRVGRL